MPASQQPETVIQGARYATLLHVEKTTIAGRPQYRLVYRFVNDRLTPSRSTLVRPEQTARNLHVGMLVRIHFCLSRVLRVERVG